MRGRGRGAPVAEVFLVFLRLGCTSFGGPVAHLGYFHAEFVERRGWLSNDTFAEIVALAQTLPGPASSQTGFAIGLLRAGGWGGVAAWLGFTLPSALLMVGFGMGQVATGGRIAQAVLHGLQLVAVAVVTQAVLAMGRTLAPDRPRQTLALIASGIVLWAPATVGMVAAMLAGAAVGVVFLRAGHQPGVGRMVDGGSRTGARVAAFVFGVGLLLSYLVAGGGIGAVGVFAGFFRAGALVFGGGHVVLPMLEEMVVGRGWIPQGAFLSGYGAAQALPGPLFTFAAYLGAAIRPNAHPLLYGLEAVVAIFLPGLLLMAAVLPFWNGLRSRRGVGAALRGLNASVVGVLLATLYRPVWTGTVHTALEFWVVALALLLLVGYRLQPWIVVLSAGGLAGILAGVGR